MVVTPWGESGTLREGMLTPGPSNPPDAVSENQRQRLFGAMVASVAERGYESTRVSDLIEISGVSLRSFYDLFADKNACFIGTVSSLVRSTIGPVLESPGPDEWAMDSRRRLGTAAALAAAQPAAAKLCLVDAYAAGPAAADLVDEAATRMENLVSERLAGSPRWDGLPPEIGTFAIGTIFEIFRSRLIDNRADRLPEVADQLAALLLHYEAPVRPLRSAARSPETRPEEREASDHAERALRGFEALLTEQPLGETTMEQVARRAKMSVRTLYANFAGREELMLAAIDSAGAQAVAAALPAYRRQDRPSEGVRAALGAFLGLLASRPNLAHLLLVATYEGGARALRRRAESLRPLESMLRRVAPAQPPVSRVLLAEALTGGLLWLARRRMAAAGPGALPGLAPICTYVVLAPLLGAEEATAAAEGKSYRRQPLDLAGSLRFSRSRPREARIATLLGQESLTVDGVVERTGWPRDEVEGAVARLLEAKAIEAVPHAGEDPSPAYRSRWPIWRIAEWERLGQSEREAISEEINWAMREEIDEAMAAGTFDLHLERFLTRIPLWLDKRGWEEVHEALTLSFDECFAIQERANQRLGDRGDPSEGFPARVHLISFEPASPEQEPET